MSDDGNPDKTDLQRRSVLEAAGIAIVGGLAAGRRDAGGRARRTSDRRDR